MFFLIKHISSYDVRENVQAFGKHWYDDGNLGGRGFFGGKNKTSYLSIENLKHKDEGSYRCRVDFKQAPSRIHKLYLQIVGEFFDLKLPRKLNQNPPSIIIIIFQCRHLK